MELLTVDVEKEMMERFSLKSMKPQIIDIPFEPTVTHKIQKHEKKLANRYRYTVRIPCDPKPNEPTKEELLASPEVQQYFELQKSNSASVRFEFPKGSYIVPDKEDEINN